MAKINWNDFPVVPEGDRPRILYAAGGCDEEEGRELLRKGWRLVDVRLLPDDTLQMRACAVLAWLSGVRQGSIIPNPSAFKFIELEARACGMHLGRLTPDAKEEIAPEDMDSILEFGRKHK